jgi:hypothetical protein
MMTFSKKAALVLGALTMALAPAGLSAAPHKNLGGAKGGAKSSVSHGGGNRGGGGGYQGGNKRPNGNNSRPNGGNNKPNRGGNNNVTINNNNNVNVSGNNRGGGGRYNNGYNNGYYNNNGHWDNDDNDFLEFVGKTAAITAGVSVVAAVIGSTTNEKPSDCQETVSNGQVYMYCNGNWYQPIQSGSQTQYQVIAPPR